MEQVNDMKQLSNTEREKVQNLLKESILIGVFNDNLENHRFSQISVIWQKKPSTLFTSSCMLMEDNNYYLIENYNGYANLYILVIDNFIPLKKEVFDFINLLNIKDQLDWFNEWYYLPKEFQPLKNLISTWVNEDKHIIDIFHQVKNMTSLEDKEVKSLLSSHASLAGSNKLKEIL